MTTDLAHAHLSIAERSATGPKSVLPDGLVRLIPRRLKIAAVLYSSAYLLSMASDEIILHLVVGAPWTFHEGHMVALVAISVSLLVAALADSSALSLVGKQRLGLWYEVISSFGIAAGTMGHLRLHLDATFLGISWVALWIAFYPLVVPATRRDAIIFSSLSALSSPLALLFWVRVLPGIEPRPSVWLYVLAPNLIAAGLGIAAAAIVLGYGRALDRAEKMGEYHLERLLGRGAMGEVWYATHQLLARPAAVKIVHPDLLATSKETAENAVARFEREARATAKLTSPHTVDVYDFGRTRDGRLYYAMALLDGVDLQHMVGQYGPLAPERVAHVLGQCCHSLEEAHSLGLVHRDVKPANVFLGKRGLDHDVATLLDFGLAKASPALDLGSCTLSGTMVAAGTPAYMAPEQYLGNPVDARTDIYSLGCMAYYLLTGALVFESDSALGMIMAHVQEAPPRPSEISELAIPEALDELVVDCLAKDPEGRPRTAGELASRLRAIEWDHPWTAARAERWWTSHYGAHPLG